VVGETLLEIFLWQLAPGRLGSLPARSANDKARRTSLTVSPPTKAALRSSSST